MKGKIITNITNKDYVYINGETGEQLTKEQFNAKHNKGIRNVLGTNRVAVSSQEGQGENGEN